MLTTPAGWSNARDGLYRMQAQVVIDGVDYDEEDIISLSTSAALFSNGTASIGGCVAKEIDLVIKPKSEIPRMAEMKVYTRPISDEWWTGWLLKGVYYIDTRQTDRVSGIMTIHGYDAMLKAEQIYLESDDPGWDWPANMGAVTNHIAGIMGVGVDVRSKVSSEYKIDYPVNLTMREVLGYIASAHAGNWIINDDGDLRLVRLADTPPETNYLVSHRGDVITFGGERILI